MSRRKTSCALALSLVLLTAPAPASQLWGVYSGSGTSVLIDPIDVNTGAVGPGKNIGMGLAFASVDDLASDPLRRPSVIWGVRSPSGASQLIAMDPFQGTILSVQPLGLSAIIIRGLAIDPTDGVFYGAAGPNLYRINEANGAVTLVGTGTVGFERGLGFDAQGNLFGILADNILIAVNKLTGATTNLGTLNLSRMEDLATRPEDGKLYGLGFGYSLYTVNTVAATVTEIGPSLPRPAGLAFTNVPESSSAEVSFLAIAIGSVLCPRRRVRRGGLAPAH